MKTVDTSSLVISRKDLEDILLGVLEFCPVGVHILKMKTATVVSGGMDAVDLSIGLLVMYGPAVPPSNMEETPSSLALTQANTTTPRRLEALTKAQAHNIFSWTHSSAGFDRTAREKAEGKEY